MHDKNLTLAAAHLQRNDREGFQTFLEAFRVFTEKKVTDCIHSPLATLPNLQGQAQICALLLREFTDCLPNADKQEKR